MVQRFLAIGVLTTVVLLGAGCNTGPDDPTTVPIGDRPGLAGPGSDGEGVVGDDGTEYPPGLLPDDFRPAEKGSGKKSQK